jgi:hypothetical protein
LRSVLAVLIHGPGFRDRERERERERDQCRPLGRLAIGSWRLGRLWIEMCTSSEGPTNQQLWVDDGGTNGHEEEESALRKRRRTLQ